MADGKKKVIVYTDWISIFEKLEDAEAGQLIKHLFRYVNDLNPTAPDRLIDIVFEPIKQTLKRDLLKWEQKSKTNQKSANERWHKQTDANASERIKLDAKNADSVIVSVIDSDIVIDSVINNQSGLIDLFNSECLEQKIWQEEICMAVGNIDLKEIPEKLKVFTAHAKSGEERIPNLKEYKRYFRNWMLNKNIIDKKNTPFTNHTPKSLL